MPLIIFSNSTKRHAEEMAKEYNNCYLQNVTDIVNPTIGETCYKTVIGIGGGKVIDYAKIYAIPNRAIAIPTTAAGAASTSHAVYWDKTKNRKIDIPTKKPIILIREKFINMSDKLAEITSYDALGHALDSYWSKKATIKSKELALKAYKKIKNQIANGYPEKVELVKAGNIAGQAIELTGTNMTHAISYPLTAIYGIPHGLAVGWAIKPSTKYQQCGLKPPEIEMELEGINENNTFIETIAKEAMTYKKIHDANKDITLEELIKLLRDNT